MSAHLKSGRDSQQKGFPSPARIEEMSISRLEARRKFDPADPDYPTTPAVLRHLAAGGRLAGGNRPASQAGSGAAAPPSAPPADPKRASRPLARKFTEADKEMIRKLSSLVPAQKLLEILNDRLVADLGSNVVRHTLQDLQAELGADGAVTAGGHNWPELRQVLERSRRAGTLAKVTTQVIDDYAVIFSLSPKQVLVLKDILLADGEPV
jgi:hypothetical protein